MSAGIYKITNLVNNKFYIGSTINFTRRKAEHFYRFRNIKGNSILKNAILKYVIENFKFEILEEFNFGEWASLNYKTELLTCREECQIKQLKPDYNIRYEELGIIRQPLTETQKERLRTLNIGRVRPEFADKIIKAVIVEDLKGNFIGEYKSMKLAGESLGVHPSMISRSCNGKRKAERKSAKQYIFKFKTKENG